MGLDQITIYGVSKTKMIVATVFGLTQGFESIIYAAKGKELPFTPPNEYIQSAIRYVNPSFDTEFFMVRRFSVTEGVLTFIGVYRGVYEIGYDRPNSYYGAGLWLLNRTVDGRLAQKFLTDLSNQIKNSAISDNRFIKKIADTSVKISSADLAKLETTDQPNTEGLSPEDSSEQCFIQAQQDVTQLIDWAQVNFTAKYFNRMYAGNPTQMISTSARTDGPLLFLSTDNATEAGLKKLAKQYDALKRSHDKLSDSAQSLTENVSDLQGQLTDAKADQKKTASDRDKIKNYFEISQTECTQLRSNNANLKSNVESLTKKNKQLDANLESAKKTTKPSVAGELSNLTDSQSSSKSDSSRVQDNRGAWLFGFGLITLSFLVHTILTSLITPSSCWRILGLALRPDIWLSLVAIWALLSSVVILFSTDRWIRVLWILLIGLLIGIATIFLEGVFPSVVCKKSNNILVTPTPAASTSALQTAPTEVRTIDPLTQKVDTVSTSTPENKVDDNTSNLKPSEPAEALSNTANPPPNQIVTIDLNSCVGPNKVSFKAFKMTYAPRPSAPADVTRTLTDLRGRLATCMVTVSRSANCEGDLQVFTDKWRAIRGPVALVMPELCAQTYQTPINPKDAKKVIEYRFEAINSVNSSPQ